MLAKAYNNVPIMPEPKDKNSLQRKVKSIGVPIDVWKSMDWIDGFNTAREGVT